MHLFSIRKFFVAFILVVAFGGHANAGEAVMKTADGKRASIICNSSGCNTIFYNSSGKRTGKTTGPGGRTNFNKIVKSLKAKGYK